jgi:hypothetical protein
MLLLFAAVEFVQENRAKLRAFAGPIFNWQAIGVHDGVNLARQSASGSAHVLLIFARDAAAVLHAQD